MPLWQKWRPVTVADMCAHACCVHAFACMCAFIGVGQCDWEHAFENVGKCTAGDFQPQGAATE